MTQLHVPGPVDNIQNPAIVVPTQGIVAPNAVAGNGAVAHNPYGALGLSTPVLGGLPKRLVISLAGFEKTGKTHLAFTGKSPIVIFNLDLGTEGVIEKFQAAGKEIYPSQTHPTCLLYTSPSPRDRTRSRMPSSA